MSQIATNIWLQSSGATRNINAKGAAMADIVVERNHFPDDVSIAGTMKVQQLEPALISANFHC
jgi:hypothetical protein